MIHHHVAFTCEIPVGWTAPQFQLGQTVEARGRVSQITGIEFHTNEQAIGLGVTEGWWYYVYEVRELPNGVTVADVGGYHESVLQPVPYTSALSYDHPIAV